MFKLSEKTQLAITLLGALSLITLASPALAQAGHPLNSVDTSPGTSVPRAPTDPVIDPDKSNNGIIRLPNSNSTSEMDKDAVSGKADRKASRKISPEQEQQQGDKSIFPNERGPRFDPTTIDTE